MCAECSQNIMESFLVFSLLQCFDGFCSGCGQNIMESLV
ncbi:hypothetical protein OIU78_008617 [Salix suchowensis]|nr:hypothetical protein OIU78_008617 [Salix suchowensis]